MGQALLKEVLKLKEWPHFSGEGEYDHMEFIRCIDMIKEDFELADRLVTARFNTLFTRSAHRRFKVKNTFEPAKSDADKDKALPCFCQQKDNKPTKPLLYPGAFCSFVGKSFLKTCVPIFEDQLLRIDGIKLNSASNPMKSLGIFETNLIFLHINGNLKITVELVVTENCSSTHSILGNDYLMMYGIDLHNNNDRYFTIGDNQSQKFAFLRFKRQIKVSNVAPVNLESERFKSEQLNEAEISLHLTNSQKNELSALLYDNREAFSSDKEPLGASIGNEVDSILNIKRPYPQILRRPEYPANPKSREVLEIHIKLLLDIGLIRKVNHNEEVEITTPVIVAWHNGKSRRVRDFRALSTYTVPDR
ncbi:hypothetical protein O181_101445 [Austropuccinia psidii MF-1]|uniref:Uncharacterized protein n=1 Tax=Austropuccinia psidii MF-1 TaxID=1389203 RepID=A0A9Q3JHK6_9BASI|nr:hypothetical protein [Austropuccinia psidii MF-1]